MESSPLSLEVCAYNFQSCIIAQEAGASRIELCANPSEGGVTPGYGTIRYAIEKINIPVYVMIRPRGGDFVYDDAELEIMRRDIQMCNELGCKGIAIGILSRDGTIDTDQMKRMVELAYPMGVTCHKAFDRVVDATQALEAIIAAGCERLLTSGLQPTAIDGAPLIMQLVTQAGDRIKIMPGGGVRSTNIEQLAQLSGAAEFHSSCLVGVTQHFTASKEEAVAIVDKLRSRTT